MMASVVARCSNLSGCSPSISNICSSVFDPCQSVARESASFDLPVFDEIVWNFLQKTRWPLEHIAVTAGQAHLWISKVKLVAGARDGHIEQTPFFLERIAHIERPAAREHPVRQPDHEHRMKLKTFRLVHRGQIDR